MTVLEIHRKLLLKQQTDLRCLLTNSDQFSAARELFFIQHTMLHSSRITPAASWSFEDAVLDDLSEVQIRSIPQGGEHSIAWLIWHITRCEDITMNLLIAGSPQILKQEEWLEKLHVNVCDTGNTMDGQEMVDFSNSIDIKALRVYRLAVGGRTQDIATGLEPGDLKRRVDPSRLHRVTEEGAVLEGAQSILSYWGNRTFAGLLLMPATRHSIIHLNEALKIKNKLQSLQ